MVDILQKYTDKTKFYSPVSLRNPDSRIDSREQILVYLQKNANRHPGVAQLVARLLWEQDAAGSNPVTRTSQSIPFRIL